MNTQSVITLDASSPAIQHLCARDKRLGRVIARLGPMTYTTHKGSEFAFLVREILEQMLSVKAAQKIYDRLVALCHGTITPSGIHVLSLEQIQSIGTSSRKAAYIKNLASAIVSGSLDLTALENCSDEQVIKALTTLHGIGTWTAKMYLIFVLDRQNVLPYEDVAFLQSYKWLYKTEDISPAAIKKKCKKWSPYASIAARYLYDVLDEGLTKEEFHLYK